MRLSRETMIEFRGTRVETRVLLLLLATEGPPKRTLVS